MPAVFNDFVFNALLQSSLLFQRFLVAQGSTSQLLSLLTYWTRRICRAITMYCLPEGRAFCSVMQLRHNSSVGQIESWNTNSGSNMAVFWGCCVEKSGTDTHFRGTLMMETVRASETWGIFYQTTQCNIQEDNLHTRRRENPKSRLVGAQLIRNPLNVIIRTRSLIHKSLDVIIRTRSLLHKSLECYNYKAKFNSQIPWML
jgi:hypothetical protein